MEENICETNILIGTCIQNILGILAIQDKEPVVKMGQKLNTQLYDSPVPFLGVYSRTVKTTYIHTKDCA